MHKKKTNDDFKKIITKLLNIRTRMHPDLKTSKNIYYILGIRTVLINKQFDLRVYISTIFFYCHATNQKYTR